MSTKQTAGFNPAAMQAALAAFLQSGGAVETIPPDPAPAQVMHVPETVEYHPTGRRTESKTAQTMRAIDESGELESFGLESGDVDSFDVDSFDMIDRMH